MKQESIGDKAIKQEELEEAMLVKEEELGKPEMTMRVKQESTEDKAVKKEEKPYRTSDRSRQMLQLLNHIKKNKAEKKD